MTREWLWLIGAGLPLLGGLAVSGAKPTTSDLRAVAILSDAALELETERLAAEVVLLRAEIEACRELRQRSER